MRQGMFSDGNVELTTPTVTVKAKRAVVVATGGSSSNVDFRRIFDPRLTAEYDGVAGDPFSRQDASGEMASMAIGASLGATANQTTEAGAAITKPSYIGCQYGYRNLQYLPGSPIFPFVRASGLRMTEWQNAILVNMLGQRFWDETKSDYDFLAACLGSVVLDAGTPDVRRVGGPIWAIFDADTVQRLKYDVTPPNVDIEDGRFFSADTLEELAGKIVNKYYESVKMPPEALKATVERYNSFVDSGADEDFGKEKPEFKIQTAPFYAAWATPCVHDTLAGLRINGKYQVIDIRGDVIPGLYAAGESASGNAMHGHGKNISGGYGAGKNAAEETAWA